MVVEYTELVDANEADCSYNLYGVGKHRTSLYDKYLLKLFETSIIMFIIIVGIAKFFANCRSFQEKETFTSILHILHSYRPIPAWLRSRRCGKHIC